LFKVEYFVEDKHLPASLRALTGLIRGLPSVIPVVNVEEEAHPSGLKPKTNGSMLEAFANHIAKLDTFGPDEVRAFLKSNGKSIDSASYLVKKASNARLLKVVGKSSAVRYYTIKQLAAPARKEA
jgi:hypothetical protein